MRMFPVAPFLVRTATADTPVSNCIIPKNAIVMLSIFNLHYVMICIQANSAQKNYINKNESNNNQNCLFAIQRKDVWGPDAEEFNPDHFLAERANERHPFCFLPFSGGPRNCIGKLL